MRDQLLLLAEGGHSEGVPPYYIGGGMFIILLCLLGITYLFSGMNQRKRATRDPHTEKPAGTTTTDHPADH